MRSHHRPQKGRRFEAASSVALRRISQPAAPRVALRWARNAALIALIIAAAAVLWMLIDDRFYIYNAEVIGAVRVSPEAVFQASDLKGYHVLWAPTAEAESRILAAFPSIESVDVACRLPARCLIAIVERQPMMTWDEEGKLWWIDADGVLFAASEVFSEGWVVSGPLPRDADGRLAEDVRAALAELWTSGAEVESLRYAPGRGLVITDVRGWRVILGTGTGMAARMRLLETLAAHLEAQRVTPRFIDLRFLEAPYYSVVNDW